MDVDNAGVTVKIIFASTEIILKPSTRYDILKDNSYISKIIKDFVSKIYTQSVNLEV